MSKEAPTHTVRRVARLNTVAGTASKGNRAVARTATNSTAVLIGRIGFVARGAPSSEARYGRLKR